ncbi:Gfo/Idh/MocA family oxidoreductase [Polaribacter haliotis]|uniref:Gfo/Idh/MocA family oxidoreductase n=1 Tax=Polaribacter haliotis TaxID=1888915 RepID=A0A7L8AED7_9FLAO|nr:Gfo/Idh/MocA family oxidoreductase [Polaribacter haliotis]QOD60209.1 Gfo/Idh/MocA family oxidoreductase [Polaribacter haliotis]
MKNSQINVALCAFGMSGYVFHAPFIDLHPNLNFYGVFERTKNEAKKNYPTVKTFRSLEDILVDDKVALVVVNTPNTTHYNFTKKVILAGKNVVVEKPFTVTVAEAEELVQLAKDKNVLLSVYHNRRWDSDFKTVKRIIDKGILGDLVDVEIHYDRFEPDLSYKTHKELPIKGVGSLYDLGSHLIDQALQLFGMPKALFANLDSFRNNSKVGDYFDVKLYYNNFYVNLKSSYFVRETLPGYILHGKKGSFIKTKADIQEVELQKGLKPNSKNWGIEPISEQGLLHIEIEGEIIKKHILSEKGDYMEYYNGISEAILNKTAVPVSAEDATDVIKIIEAAIKSSEEQQVVEL